MTSPLRGAALLLLVLSVAPYTYAGPTAFSRSQPAAVSPNGWNNTSVDVLITAGASKGATTITFEIFGAQATRATTVPGSKATVPIRAEGVSQVRFFATDATGMGGLHFHDVRIDRTPPESGVVLTRLPNGDYSATITATDPILPGGSSGVKEIHYNIYNINGLDPEQVVAGDTATVLLPGWTNLIYWAIDAVGNEESYKTVTLEQGLEARPSRLELTAPVGEWGAPGILNLVQTGMVSTDIESITTDSPYFRPDGACVFPMVGILACSLGVEFFAPAPFEYDATLYIKTNNAHHPYYTVELHGRGTLPGLAFSPDPVEFPITDVGSKSAAVTVRITNDGTAPLDITALLTDASVFPIVNDRCAPKPFVVAPASSCEVDVAFVPYGYGLHPGALEVQSNLAGGPRSVPFEAFGMLPTQLTASPPRVDFGEVQQGGSASIKLEIRNDGMVPFFVQSFSFVGAGAAMYQIVSARCTNGLAPVSLEPRQVCGLELAYLPTAAGVHDVVLRADSSMGQPAFDVPITGWSP